MERLSSRRSAKKNSSSQRSTVIHPPHPSVTAHVQRQETQTVDNVVVGNHHGPRYCEGMIRWGHGFDQRIAMLRQFHGQNQDQDSEDSEDRASTNFETRPDSETKETALQVSD